MSIDERRERLRKVAWVLALLFIFIRTTLGFWLNVPTAGARNSLAQSSASASNSPAADTTFFTSMVRSDVATTENTPTVESTPTPTNTPIPTPSAPCGNIDPRLNFGAPDGKIFSVGPQSCTIVDLPRPLIGDGSPDYDLVFYEAYTPSSNNYISLDWVFFEVSKDGNSWLPIFVWDRTPGSGRHSNVEQYGVEGPKESSRIPTADLYGQSIHTGVLIDIDAVVPHEPYNYLRIRRPAGSVEGAQVDAVDVVHEHPKPTSTPTGGPTVVPSPTNTPTEVPSPTNTPTEVPSPTNTPTEVPSPPTNTPTVVPPSPTNTPTVVPPPPTNTPTVVPPPPTNTPSATSRPPITPTTTSEPRHPTNTPTSMPAPSTVTPTDTPVPPTSSPTKRPAATLTDTPVAAKPSQISGGQATEQMPTQLVLPSDAPNIDLRLTDTAASAIPTATTHQVLPTATPTEVPDDLIKRIGSVIVDILVFDLLNDILGFILVLIIVIAVVILLSIRIRLYITD